MSETSAWPSISVIVPTYRRFRPVLSALRDLLAQDYDDLEIVVADQNREWPFELQSEFEKIRSRSNIRWLIIDKPGVVAARNEAVRMSRGDILLFIDDDVEIANRRFVRRHAWNYRDPEVAAVAGRECALERQDLADFQWDERDEPVRAQCYSSQSALVQALSFDRDSSRRVTVSTFCTCNGSIRRDAFLAVGGFDENFSGNSYGDDFDLAIRLDRAGYRPVYDPEAALVHLRVPMGGLRLSDAGNPFNEFDRALSSWLFILRHGNWRSYPSLIHWHLLRKTVLLKRNVVRPWRQPAVWFGVIAAFFEAQRRLRSGPRSRLAGHQSIVTNNGATTANRVSHENAGLAS